MSSDLKHFVDILDTLDAIVWEANAETFVFTYVNDAAGRILGYPPEEWIGTEGFWESFIHPDDHEPTLEYCRKAAAATRDHEFDYRAIAADGRTVWLHDVVHVVKDHGGAPVLLRGVMTDITERKEAEELRSRHVDELRFAQEQLAESEARYRLLSELTTDYAWSLRIEDNGDWRSEWVSDSFERVTGYKTEVFQQSGWQQLLHPDDLDLAHGAFVKLQQGRPMDVELRLIRADGSTLWVHAIARPLVDEGGGVKRIVGSARDITERKVTEEQRKRLESQLLQSQKMEAVGRLAGGIAHDFNNILSAILNYARFIQQNPEDTATVASDAAEIVTAGERAAALTRQLLVFSRRETPHLEPLDLNQVVVDQARFLERTLGEDLELRLELAPNVGRVLADRVHIEQILLNLAVNSRDAMPQGGTLTIAVDRSGASAVSLTVTDTGYGIDPEVAGRAFEPFFTTKPAGQGTGLGLATVYGIAETLGGSARIERVATGGTIVEVILPAVGDEIEETGGSADIPELASRSLHLLVVEDEDQLRTLMSRMLRRDGHEVTAASSSEEALELDPQVLASVDLVLTDVVLPGMSGVELARELTKTRADLRILYMSGYPADVIDAQGGIDGFLLEKPFGQGELRRAIRQEMGGA